MSSKKLRESGDASSLSMNSRTNAMQTLMLAASEANFFASAEVVEFAITLGHAASC